MDNPSSLQRMAQNEVVFRKANERAQKGLERLKKLATDHGDSFLLKDGTPPLHFLCECSDENCRERIVIKTEDYKKLHKNASQFLIIPGHQVATIERVVLNKPEYTVVEKYMTTPKNAEKLKHTDINNV